jgi:predicted SprT family Zn-dependent metalloprotease
MKYYCENCGSEIVLQDDVWLGDNKKLCPICGSGDTDLQELPVYETVAQWEKRKGCEYPEKAPVYALQTNYTGTKWYLHRNCDVNEKHTVVATEAGATPDDWRPE